VEPALLELLAEGSPDDEVAVIVRLSDPVALPAGVRIVAQFGPIVTCRLRRGDIPRVRGDAPVRSMKAARFYGPSLAPCDWARAEDEGCGCSGGGLRQCGCQDDAAERDVDETPDDRRRPEGDLPTGRGVVVAHIDWGVDFAHPDFRDADGRTRILSIWDQSAPYSPQHANRYGFGRIYDSAEIDRALAEPDPYMAMGYTPATSDRGAGSHGTHTLGISSGNGRAGGPAGIAPEAKQVFVHLSTYTSDGPTLLGDSVALLEAYDFTARVAGTAPVVINASLGRQAGEHTGTTLTEQGMDAFLLAAPGRAIVQSTGNYYDRDIHARGTLRPGEQRTIRLITDVADRTPNEVDLWYPGVDRLRVTLRGPNRVVEVVVSPGEKARVTVDGKVVGNLYHRLADPNNGDNQVLLVLYQGAPPGEWDLVLFGEDVADGRYHIWVERDAACPKCQARFAHDDSDPTSTTGTICNGLRTIAVGAYDGRSADRTLAPFSSSGPTRDGRQKPDLAAPGVRVLSARSGPHHDDGRRGLLTRMSGTSMAAPHVTGTIALMFEAAGRPLFIEETRRLLLASADPPFDRLSAPERLRLGSGYLNVSAAVEAARRSGRALAAVVQRSAAIVSPNVKEAVPNSDQLAITDRYEAMADINEAFDMEQDESRHTASDWVPAPEWMDETEGQAEMEASEAKDRQYSQGYDRRPASLPFQFQIPLGGGSPALAVPFGGAGSPFAVAVPFGTPATPLIVQPPAEPQASAAGAPSAEPPLTVAMADTAPPFTFGDHVLRAAEASLDEQHRGSSGWLESVLGGAASAESAYAEGDDTGSSPFALAGRTPSATTLFNALTQSNHPLRPRGTLRDHYAPHFAILAQPGEPWPSIEPKPGDLLLRVARGEGWGHVAVIATPGLYWYERLPDADLRGEGYPLPLPGWYVHVVESGPHAHPSDHRFARRLCDARGVMLADTLLLRPLSVGGVFSETEAETAPTADAPASPPDASSGARGTLGLGARGDAVVDAQRRLNRVHADAVALGLPGLTGCPLPEDGNFDKRMQQAVTEFQQQVFSDPAKWDGSIGPDTTAQLVLVTGSGPAPLSGSTAPPAPPAAPAPPSGRSARRAAGSRTSRAEMAEGAGAPMIRVGSRGPAVVEAQHKLNIVHNKQTAQGLPGLPNCPLVEDGVFGDKTRRAVVGFQQLAFPNQPSEWDGVVGPKTSAALDLFAQGASPIPPIPVPPLPVPPLPRPVPPVAARCALTPVTTSDPTTPAVSHAGTVDFSAGTITTSTGVTLHVRGNAFYPATSEGSSTDFDTSTGRTVPIVFIAHGNHATAHDPANRSQEFCLGAPGTPAGAIPIPNHLGYVYLQEQLARLGIASVSVDCNETNCIRGRGQQNITDRAELIAAAIRHFQALHGGSDRIFGGHLDFNRVGLLGHSRGGEAVLLVPELRGSRAAAGATFKAVLSLAPTNVRITSGTPRGFAFMTILPAGDGDVRFNNGAEFYDKAVPSPFKSQLYVHAANHNFFNTEWVANPDTLSGAVRMTPAEHQRILSVYACALFRTSLGGASFERIVTGRETPPGVRSDNLHVSSEISPAVTVDDHDDGTPAKNTLQQPITKFGYATADEKPFDQTPAAFNGSFFGNTKGLIVKRSATSNQFTSPLPQPTDLTGKEVWIRCAEVYTGSVPSGAASRSDWWMQTTRPCSSTRTTPAVCRARSIARPPISSTSSRTTRRRCPRRSGSRPTASHADDSTFAERRRSSCT
jgi:peptidoglycan hydrolase-like protein with peptidoglycan-binding domain/subtilisin family serine protease